MVPASTFSETRASSVDASPSSDACSCAVVLALVTAPPHPHSKNIEPHRSIALRICSQIRTTTPDRKRRYMQRAGCLVMHVSTELAEVRPKPRVSTHRCVPTDHPVLRRQVVNESEKVTRCFEGVLGMFVLRRVLADSINLGAHGKADVRRHIAEKSENPGLPDIVVRQQNAADGLDKCDAAAGKGSGNWSCNGPVDVLQPREQFRNVRNKGIGRNRRQRHCWIHISLVRGKFHVYLTVPLSSSGRIRQASVEMTMRYAHLGPDVRRNTLRTLDPDLGRGTL